MSGGTGTGESAGGEEDDSHNTSLQYGTRSRFRGRRRQVLPYRPCHTTSSAPASEVLAGAAAAASGAPTSGSDGAAEPAAPPETGPKTRPELLQCTRIATFMFKGGVYKTMTTVLAASALAAEPYNYKVLIVDADSQCNATSFFMPEPSLDATGDPGGEGGDGTKDRMSATGLEGAVAEVAGQQGAARAAQQASMSNISLSEPNVMCPRNDVYPGDFYKTDTWLEQVNARAEDPDSGQRLKFNTIYDLLRPEFDQGSAEMADPEVIPVTHFLKKTQHTHPHLKDDEVICQYEFCERKTLKSQEQRNQWIKGSAETEWFCSEKCSEARQKQHTLFLLPGSTKLSSLESRMSDDVEETSMLLMWAAFDKLFKKLAVKFSLDFIFIDLGPNHGKLNKAFALNCHAILPPLHADFYSATSMCRMLEKKGVLSQWDEWRQKNREKLPGIYAQMPKLLPFLVSGYETEKSKKKDNERYKDKKTQFECGKVQKHQAIFVASMQMAIEDEDGALEIPDNVKRMFKRDGCAMVIPFCRSLKDGVGVSERMGVPLPQIHLNDVKNSFDGQTWNGDGKSVCLSDDVWNTKLREDCTQADFKFSAGQQLEEACKKEGDKPDSVEHVNRAKEILVRDRCLASFLVSFARDRVSQAPVAPPDQQPGSLPGDIESASQPGQFDDDETSRPTEATMIDVPGPVPEMVGAAEQEMPSSLDESNPPSRARSPSAAIEDRRPTKPFLKPVEPFSSGDPVTSKCVVISVYNYKGGVAKSTTAIQLAATLAKQGRKVCLVDADGQCNSTAFFHPKLQTKPSTSGEQLQQQNQDVQPECKIPADQLPPNTVAYAVNSFKPDSWLEHDGDYDFTKNNIHGMLAPLFSGGRVMELRAPKLLSIDDEFYHNNLLLLPGSIELLTVKFKHQTEMFECRHFGVVRKMFRMMAEARYGPEGSPQLEFIIVDLGPSVDDLNKAFVMSSDYILPPVKADYFSAISVRGLLYEVLPDFRLWRKRHHELKFDSLSSAQRDELRKGHFYDFGNPDWPKVLPFLVNDHVVERKTPKMKGEATMEKVSSDFLHDIRNLVEECGKLEGEDDEYQGKPEIRAGVKEMIVYDKDGNAAVPFCHHLERAPGVSHRWGVPIVHLSEKPGIDFHLPRKQTDKQRGTGKEESKYAKDRFETLAKFLKEQRRICLRQRYNLDVPNDDDDEDDVPAPSPNKSPPKRRSRMSEEGGNRRKSARVADRSCQCDGVDTERL